MPSQVKYSYQKKIISVKNRRTELKEYMMKRFGWNGLFSVTGKNVSNKILVSKAYTLAARTFTNNISNLSKSRNRFEERQDKVDKIGKLVQEFMNVKITFMYAPKDDERVYIGRCMLSKYVLENLEKCNGKHIRNYLSPYHPMRSSTPATWRYRFTKSFSKFPERKKLYHDFVSYVKHNTELS